MRSVSPQTPGLAAVTTIMSAGTSSLMVIADEAKAPEATRMTQACGPPFRKNCGMAKLASDRVSCPPKTRPKSPTPKTWTGSFIGPSRKKSTKAPMLVATERITRRPLGISSI